MKVPQILFILLIVVFLLPAVVFAESQKKEGNVAPQQVESTDKYTDLVKENNELKILLAALKSEVESLKKDKTSHVDLEKLRSDFVVLEKTWKERISSESVLVEKNLFSQMLDVSEKNLQTPYFIVAFLTLFVAILSGFGIMLYRGLRDKVKADYIALEDDIKSSADKLKDEITASNEIARKDHEEQGRQISLALARTYNLNAISLYTRSPQEAINQGSKAVEQCIAAFGENPSERGGVYLLGSLKSNLAYYYAHNGVETKSAMALEYAEVGLEVGQKFQNIDMIDNFLYVTMIFGKTEEYEKKWKDVYIRHDKMVKYEQLDDDERKVYSEYYKKIS